MQICHGKKITIIEATTHDCYLEIKALDKGMNGEDFQQFLTEDLVSKLWSEAMLVMDNMPAHKVTRVTKIIEDTGAKIVYVSPYSPEFNPFENLWSQLNIFLRQFTPKAQTAVEQLLNIALMLSNRDRFLNWCAHCCYHTCKRLKPKVYTITLLINNVLQSKIFKS